MPFKGRVACVGALAVMGVLASAPDMLAQTDAPPAGVAPAASIPDTPAGKALRGFLDCYNKPGCELDPALFAEAFLKQVPAQQLNLILNQLRGQLGDLALQRIELGATDSKLVAIVKASKGEEGARLNRVIVNVEPDGKMSGLLVQPAPSISLPALKSWDEFGEKLDGLAANASFAAFEYVAGKTPSDPFTLKPIATHNAEKPLALGSTFKLYILAALGEQMRSGRLAFNRPLAIEESRKSLPSGEMQNLKAGEVRDIREFALKMISISDNTATDHLLHLVGRDAVQALYVKWTEPLASVPGAAKPIGGHGHGATLPFLSTREIFQLKLAADRDVPKMYAEADVLQRQRFLGASDPKHPVTKAFTETPNILMAAAWAKPQFVDSIEWFASTTDACRIMGEVYRLSKLKSDGRPQAYDLTPIRGVISANPGLPLDKSTWPFIGFKGGSEPGVLNLTYVLEHSSGKVILFSASLMDTRKVVDQDKAIALVQRGIDLLAPAKPAAKPEAK